MSDEVYPTEQPVTIDEASPSWKAYVRHCMERLEELERRIMGHIATTRMEPPEGDF